MPLVDRLASATIRALMRHNSAAFAFLLCAVLSFALSALPVAHSLAVAPYPPGTCTPAMMRGFCIRGFRVKSGACARPLKAWPSWFVVMPLCAKA